jgi:hypothetical protein
MTPEEIQRLLATSKLSLEEQQRLQGVLGQPANASSSAYGQNVIGQSSTNVQRQNIAQFWQLTERWTILYPACRHRWQSRFLKNVPV